MTTIATPSRSRSSDRESRGVRAAARELGMTANSCGQLVRQNGIHIRLATIIRHLVATDDERTAERLFAPVEAARMGLAPEAVTVALIESEERADAAEGVAQTLHLAAPTPTTRRAWINALRMQRARSLELLLALEAEEAAR